MPNWCSNTAYITGPAETLQWLESSYFNFEVLRPRPADQEENWYDWNVANWGTKWPAHDVEIDASQGDTLKVTFRTAWSPPAALLTYLANEHGLRIRNVYVGECYEYVGQDIYDNDEVVSEYIQPPDKTDEEIQAFAAQHNWFPYEDWRALMDAMMGGGGVAADQA